MIPEEFVSSQQENQFFQSLPLPRAVLCMKFVHGHEVDSSEHNHSNFQFLQQEKKKCDACLNFINRGELVSKGDRTIYIEEEHFPVQGDDIIHWYCLEKFGPKYYKQPYDTDATNLKPPAPTLEESLKSKLIRIADISKLDGFNILSTEEKEQLLRWNQQTVTDEILQTITPLKGMVCIITGIFTKSKEIIVQEIRDLGGDVKDTITANVNCCILGEDGETDYGQATGSKSKKYKEFKVKKKKCPILSEKQLRDLMQDTSKTFEEKFATEIASLTKKRKGKAGGNESKKSKK